MLLISSALAACPVDAACAILPLGDSITDGYYFPGGYRVELEALLEAGGYRFDFVGGLQNGPTALADQDHQGLSGWRIDQIDGTIGNRMVQLRPDVVLLHLGTNDLYQDHGVVTAAGRMRVLLEHILAIDADTTLLVAGILPTKDPGYDAKFRAFNLNVWGIVRDLATAGFDVHYVDQHTGFPPTLLVDRVHPGIAGFARMANTWYDALVGAW